MKTFGKILFTKFVIVMVFLPIPPSTIIGVAIISHPKTNKYLDPRMLAAMYTVQRGMKSLIKLFSDNQEYRAKVVVSVYK